MGGVTYYDEAEAALQRAIDIDPKAIEPRIFLVFIYLGAGEKQKARDLVEKLRREAPNNSVVHNVAGTLYRLDGLYDEALREFDRQLKINPTEVVLVAYNRARIFMYRGMLERAEEELMRGIAVEPDHPLQNVFLARVRFYQGRYDEAAELFESVFEKAPSAQGLRPLQGMVYSARGEHERALALLNHDVIDGACADHDVAYWLASLYAMENDKEDALAWLERAADLGNENFPWFARDSAWDDLRADPDYVALIERLKARKAEAQAHV
jgi:serine/threonine-protein kinase